MDVSPILVGCHADKLVSVQYVGYSRLVRGIVGGILGKQFTLALEQYVTQTGSAGVKTG